MLGQRIEQGCGRPRAVLAGDQVDGRMQGAEEAGGFVAQVDPRLLPANRVAK
jgi:hypothetical protein